LEHRTADADDLDPGHSLAADPTIARMRETAAMLGQDIWIAVKLPGDTCDSAISTDSFITQTAALPGPPARVLMRQAACSTDLVAVQPPKRHALIVRRACREARR
jgi:hypothetical protein